MHNSTHVCLLVIWLDIHGAFHLSSLLNFFLLNPSSDSFNIGFNWASIEFNRINIDKISKAISLQSTEKNCVNTSEKDFSFVHKLEKLIKKISSIHNPSFSFCLSFPLQ